MQASGVFIIWKKLEAEPQIKIEKSNTNMKAASPILTSLTLFCEFPQNIMYKFSYKNPEM